MFGAYVKGTEGYCLVDVLRSTGSIEGLSAPGGDPIFATTAADVPAECNDIVSSTSKRSGH